MRIEEIKVGLIEHFFGENSTGIDVELIDPILESLGSKIELDLKKLNESPDSSGVSNNPDKAFRRFIDGDYSLLTIHEDEEFKTKVIFAAARLGKKVFYEDLTKTNGIKLGDFKLVKGVLRQAKNIDEDVCFMIKTKDSFKRK